MSKPSTIQGKYSAAGEGNVYARANVATCKITANDTDGTFEIFDEHANPASNPACTCTPSRSRSATCRRRR